MLHSITRALAVLVLAVALTLSLAPAASAVPGLRPPPAGSQDQLTLLMKRHHCGPWFKGHKVRGHIVYVGGFRYGFYTYRKGLPTEQGRRILCSR